jgi:hypothetical protein
MAKYTHLVVAINHDTGEVSFDGDGSREWIRTLFEPETNTWDEDTLDWAAPDLTLEREALDLLMNLGIKVDGMFYDNWQER